MRLLILRHFIFPILVLSSLQTPIFAIQKNYIVYLGSNHAKDGFVRDPASVTSSHHEMLSSLSSSNVDPAEKITYSYNKLFNGFGAVLEEEEAEELKKHPHVVSIFESRTLKPMTSRTWEFLGLEKKHITDQVHANELLWERLNFGEDIIAAAIDSGVSHVSKSFKDDGYGPIPKRFKGQCDKGDNPKFTCNRKLIGARYFYKGFLQAFHQLQNITYKDMHLNPEDDEGHGSHVQSIMAGNFVPNTSFYGYANGTVKGGIPRARLVSYKACWTVKNAEGCVETDILAAIEAAISDGVDIINLSVGGYGVKPYFEDATAIGTFHAMEHNIPTICGAGNSGPQLGTVDNVAPWTLTVAACSIDRDITNEVILGNNKRFQGGTYWKYVKALGGKFYPLISATNAYIAGANVTDASLCSPGTIDPLKVKGKILVCILNVIADFDTGMVRKLGAVGLILANDKSLGGVTDALTIDFPSTHISFNDGQALLSYINSTRSPVATITGATTKIGIKPAPKMYYASSRGPNLVTEDILKPDVTAPGVSILAATIPSSDSYMIFSGTSMASPHAASVVGLLRKLYPHWSPSAIKSAIITTATPIDNTGKVMLEMSSDDAATPFGYGSGLIQPNLAADPGLVYDMDYHYYLGFLCTQFGFNKSAIQHFSNGSYTCPKSGGISNFNYPSITIFYFEGNATITRKLKNVGQPGLYTAHIESPKGVTTLLQPKTLLFSRVDQIIEYKLIFTAPADKLNPDYAFGSIVWSDGKHAVRSPIVIIPKDKIEHDQLATKRLQLEAE